MSRFTFQAITVFIAVSFQTYLTDDLGFRSGLNILWMFGLPVTIAIIANKDAVSRLLAGLVLVVLSPITMMATAVVLGLGP